jgi:DNA gyrase subunit A
VQKLFDIIPGPDFPTGGLILGRDGARKFQKTGHGSVVLRAKCHVESGSSTGAAAASGNVNSNANSSGSKTNPRSRTAIVVTELPYMTNKAGKI